MLLIDALEPRMKSISVMGLLAAAGDLVIDKLLQIDASPVSGNVTDQRGAQAEIQLDGGGDSRQNTELREGVGFEIDLNNPFVNGLEETVRVNPRSLRRNGRDHGSNSLNIEKRCFRKILEGRGEAAMIPKSPCLLKFPEIQVPCGRVNLQAAKPRLSAGALLQQGGNRAKPANNNVEVARSRVLAADSQVSKGPSEQAHRRIRLAQAKEEMPQGLPMDRTSVEEASQAAMQAVFKLV